MRHNLLYVIDNLEFGGGERVFSQIINRLSGERYKIMVACLPTGIFVEKIKGSGAMIRPVDMSNRSNFKIILQLIGLMKEQKIDIVHSQGARADFFARMAAMFARVSIVISTVPMTVEGFDVNPIRKLIYKAFSQLSERLVDRFMVVSDALEKTMIEKHRIEHQRIVKIYNGIDTDDFCLANDEIMRIRTEFRNELGLGGGIPIIGVIGRLVWQKGFEYFIDSIPEVLKEFKEARFLIVGDGTLDSKLKAASKTLKVDDKIIFTGFKRDIKEVLAVIDIFVMPSLLEGLPMILLESMAMAKPIIATDIEGIQEVLENGITGLLVPPRDPKVLSEAIIDLLNHRDKACLIGATARKVVEERFRVDVMVQKVEEVYEELLQQNRE